MHITYDLPVSIDDILEAKQLPAGKIYNRYALSELFLASCRQWRNIS